MRIRKESNMHNAAQQTLTMAAELSGEIDEMRNSLTTDHMDMSFGELTGMYERGELVIDPSFQCLYR